VKNSLFKTANKTTINSQLWR